MPIASGMSGSSDPRSGSTGVRTRILGTTLGLLVAVATAASAQTIVISQVSGGSGGEGAPYAHDFVELHNTGHAPVSLEGLSLQYAPGAGLLNFSEQPITPLSGTLPAGAYHLVEMASGGSGAELPGPDDVGDVDLGFYGGKVALVRGLDGLVCNGGTAPCDAAAQSRIVDLLGYGNADFFEGSTGAAQGAWYDTALVRAGDGCVDTNDNLADFAPIAPAPRTQASPVVVCAAPPPPPPPPPPAACVPTHTIAQVQGSGAVSPWTGADVSLAGVVTARLATGPRLGFFLQMPAGDGDPSTSDAIFVATADGQPPLEAMPGNAVCVDGAIAEIAAGDERGARPITQLLPRRVVLVAASQVLPAPVTLTAADTPAGSALDALERFEGMRVRVATLSVVAPTRGIVDVATASSASTGVFHGVVSGVARPFREPGIDVHDGLPAEAPAGVPIFDGNLERLRVDSAALGLVPLDVATGATIANLVGPLHYAGRTYTILAEATPGVTAGPASAAAAALPAPRPSEFTTAVLDAEQLFDADDAPEHDDVVVTPAALTRRIAKLSRHVRTVLQTPDLIGVQDVETLAVLEALATRINADAVAAGQPDPRYRAYLVDGQDSTGLDIGVLARTARVTVLDVQQQGRDTMFVDPYWGWSVPLHDRPPVVVRASVALPGGAVPVTVVVAHLRRGADMADPFQGASVRSQRAAQAESVAAIVQERQLAAPGEPLVVLVDADAPAFNDGHVDVTGTIAGVPVPATAAVTPTADLVDPDLGDALADVAPASRYTTTAGGTADQRLQVLVNGAAADLQSRAFIAHANADLPDAWRNDPTRAERASASDVPVVYFEVAAPEPPPSSPAEITGLVRVRLWKWLHHRHQRGVAYVLVDATNVSGRKLSGPFVLGIQGLPAGASVLNATGTIASMPAVRVPWVRTLRPGRTMRTWVVLRGVPAGVTPKVRVFVAK